MQQAKNYTIKMKKYITYMYALNKWIHDFFLQKCTNTLYKSIDMYYV